MSRLTIVLFVVTVLLAGCASKHPYMSKPAGLDPSQWQCGTPDAYSSNCQLVQQWQPAQLSSVGCVAHTIVTGGHIAWECRKPKNGRTPTGGRWIWRKEKK